ncbi:hypothetical protein [Methanolobus profundi]|uniref:hypothetical protein n=1 Tax=Methanolobus profundi TaxID=487685 RepID=UPI0015A63FBB|nr:hypothetical protein [Methanolobus profundi]
MGNSVVQSANGNMSSFAHLVHSLPDYSELIIVLLILLLLLVSIDDIIDFFYVVKDIFSYKGMPFN